MQGMNRSKLLSAAMLAGGLAASVWAIPQNLSQAATKVNSQATSSTGAFAAARKGSAGVRAGTKVSAALESSLDARTAKPGDRVVARVSKNVKQYGRVVIHKGDRLIGRVTQVRTGARGKGGSSMAVAFNQLESGGTTTQLNTVLKSVFVAQGQGGMAPEPMQGPPPMPMIAPASRGGGGLLGGGGSVVGGVASTVGSTVGGAASAAGGLGSTVAGASQASLGRTAAAGLATPMGAIHLGAEGSAQSSSGVNSVLSTRRGDLRLNSGTQLQFRVAAEGQAGRTRR